MNKRVETINLLDNIEVKSSVTKVTSGYNSLDTTENCPVCKLPMARLTVGFRSKAVQAMVCITDRIALPPVDESN